MLQQLWNGGCKIKHFNPNFQTYLDRKNVPCHIMIVTFAYKFHTVNIITIMGQK